MCHIWDSALIDCEYNLIEKHWFWTVMPQDQNWLILIEFLKKSNTFGQWCCDASSSEFIHFRYNSKRKALIVNSHASRSELPYSHWNLKETQCFWTVALQAQNSFNFGMFLPDKYWFWTVAQQHSNCFNFNTILIEKYWFWTVTPRSLWIDYFSMQFWNKHNQASGSELITSQCNAWRQTLILGNHASRQGLIHFQ